MILTKFNISCGRGNNIATTMAFRPKDIHVQYLVSYWSKSKRRIGAERPYLSYCVKIKAFIVLSIGSFDNSLVSLTWHI